MKIGFFDSGIGGFSVLRDALKILKNEQFLFYADKKHVPYGEKTREEILEYTCEAVDFMIHQDVKAIVIACNTATSVAIESLREKYDLPIIGIEPAVKKALDEDKDGRVLVCATPVTIQGEKLRKLIERVDEHHQTELLPLPKLVRFAESGDFESKEVKEYLEKELSKFDVTQISSLVLGCTHFNYFKDSFRKLTSSHVKLVDGNDGVIRQLIRKLEENNLLENHEQTIDFYYSKEKVEDAAELKKINDLFIRLDEMAKL